jgi:hypothetical protein
MLRKEHIKEMLRMLNKGYFNDWNANCFIIQEFVHDESGAPMRCKNCTLNIFDTDDARLISETCYKAEPVVMGLK